jgi:hypothetical protein
MNAKRGGFVEIDVSPLDPFLDPVRAARISAEGANCPLAGDAPCLQTGRLVRFSFDMGSSKNKHPPHISLSIVGKQRPTYDEVLWFFRFSNVKRGVEFPAIEKQFVRHFTIGNKGDYVTLLPGGSA